MGSKRMCLLSALVLSVVPMLLLSNRTAISRLFSWIDSTDRIVSRNPEKNCHDSSKRLSRHVDEVCREYQRKGRRSTELRSHQPLNAVFASQFVIVDDQHQMIYCSIPKVASTTFKKLIAQAVIGDGQRLPCPVHNDTCLESLGFRILGRMSSEEIHTKLSNYFKFLIVRHPFVRLLSSYEDKFSRRHHNFLSCEQYRKRVELYFDRLRYDREGYPMLNLEQFLEIVAKDRYFRNRHWANYMVTCQPCRISYDHVVRLESLWEDAGVVLDRLGYGSDSNRSGMALPHDNRSGLSDKLSRMYDRLRNINPDILNRLLTIYGSDLEMFGYSWNNSSIAVSTQRTSC